MVQNPFVNLFQSIGDLVQGAFPGIGNLLQGFLGALFAFLNQTGGSGTP